MEILAVVLAVVGIIGSIVPGIPGPPISWAALLLLYFTPESNDISSTFLLITALLAIIITILDFVVPAWGTKRFGGSKSGTWGSTIGLLVSIFVLPVLGITIGPFGIIGILAGPFLGAYIGEKMHGTDDNVALKAAFGSFIGFLAGTIMKLVYGCIILFFVAKEILEGLF